MKTQSDVMLIYHCSNSAGGPLNVRRSPTYVGPNRGLINSKVSSTLLFRQCLPIENNPRPAVNHKLPDILVIGAVRIF